MNNEKVRIFLFAIIASLCFASMMYFQNKPAQQVKQNTATPKTQTDQIQKSDDKTDLKEQPKDVQTKSEVKPNSSEQTKNNDSEIDSAKQDTPDQENQKIEINTQKYKIVFNTLGGTLDLLELVGINKTHKKDSPEYKLIEKVNTSTAGSFAIEGFESLFQKATFKVTQTKTEKGITLSLNAIKKGIEVEKIIELNNNEYDFNFKIKITNHRKTELKNTLQLVGISDMEFDFSDPAAFLNDQIATMIEEDGDLISAGDVHFWSKTYGARQGLTTLHDEPFIMGPNRKTENGKHDKAKVLWGGLKNRYFTIIYKPQKPDWTVTGFDLNKDKTKLTKVAPQLSLIPPATTISPNSSFEESFLVYAGPMKTSIINSDRYSKDKFVEMIDYGFMFPRFVKVFEGVLNFIVNTIGLYYWLSVITLTLLVRLLMFPITKKASMSQAKLQAVAPKMKELKEKYKNDTRKLNEEMMKLYRNEGVNPFTSCLPMFIQMPIFFGLYSTFTINYDVRFQSFLWINDLAIADRLFPLGITIPILGAYFNLLPIIYSVINYITMSNMPPAQDEMQAQQQKIMKYMFPIMMLLFFYQMPSALVLYFIVSGIWSIVEQKQIKAKLELMKAK